MPFSVALFRRHRRRIVILLTLLLLLDPTLAARGAMRGPDPAPQPLLLAPLAGGSVVASALRFSFSTPAGFTRRTLLLSRSAFDPQAPGPEVQRFPVSGVTVSFETLGEKLTRPTPYYWALAAADPATGRVRTSAVRQVTVLPRFQVATAGSPAVRSEHRGRLPEAAGSAARGGRRASRHIRLASGIDFDTRAGAPALSPQGAGGLSAGAGPATRSLLVQFDHPPAEAERGALAAAGAPAVAYVPDNALLVRVAAGDAAKIAALPGVDWVGDYAPAYRLSPRLSGGAGGGTDTLVVLLFPDASNDQVAARAAALGADILVSSDNGVNRILHLRFPAARALELARIPGVAWIEPRVTARLENDQAQWVVQTGISGNRRLWTEGITGAGQIIHTSDSGITVTHNQFSDPSLAITTFGDYPTHRKIIAYKRGSNSPAIAFGDHSGAVFHGTHTAGSFVGSDDGLGSSLRDGMAKDARIYFHDLSGPSMGNAVDHFADLNDLYAEAYAGNAAGGARISSNSWGGNSGGQYDVSCMQVDQFMWSHPDFLIFFSNGNAGTAGSVGSPASAKDIVSAGGTGNGSLETSLYTTTSRGPTLDGRLKPTVCSPGQLVYSADGSTTSGYKALSGTSMASPTQAGAAALIRQYLTDGWYPTGTPVPANGFEPSAALLKAMVVASAKNNVTGYNAPDNNIGWGRVTADNVCYFSGDAQKLLALDQTAGLADGEYIEYQIQVVSSSQPLKAALCWTDYPASPAAARQIVNDLDLTVSHGATVYHGNHFSAGFSTTGGGADSVNVEEGVLIASPAPGIWTVRVEAPSVPFGPQPYGLVLTGDLNDGAGTLALDRAEYGSTSTMHLRVVDIGAGDSVMVSVSSPTEPAGETVWLPGANGIYEGSLALAPWQPGVPHAAGALRALSLDAADDTLRVSHGDVLSAQYTDVSTGAGLAATAHVAIETPVISDVGAVSQGTTQAAVTWNTDLNATSRVEYGLTPALELGSLTDSTYSLTHELLLSGLAPGATYYYDVESTGLNDNLVRDDNGGQHYRVTVNRPADVLLIVGDSSFNRLQAYQDAFAAAGWSYDVWSGALADSAALGDTTAGLRAYRAVIWQAGFEQYPPFSDPQRTTIGNYLSGGGRLAVVGHDIAWSFGDPSSPVYTAAANAWLSAVLHTTWQADPLSWSSLVGYAGDPISGTYTGGVAYTPVRDGAAGDEVNAVAGGGTAAYCWRDNATPDDVGFRWTSGVSNGSPDSAAWGGQPSRLATLYFEWSALRPPFSTPDSVRTDILDKTLVWLIGRSRPDVTLTAPAAGDTVTGDTLSVVWTEAAHGGASIGRRVLEYSPDGGHSWATIADSAGASPFSWDVTGLPNGADCRLRLKVEDDGVPSLSSTAVTGAFLLQRPGGDAEGPLVVPGSIVAAPNPFVQGSPAALTARVTDLARGGAVIAAAEWSTGAAPASPGAGNAMSGAFAAATDTVSGAVTTRPLTPGPHVFWIRGRDAAGNWGPADSLSLLVNPGEFATAAAGCPADTVVTPSSVTGLPFTVTNTGAAADTLRWSLTDLGPGPDVALTGGNQSGSVWLDPAGAASFDISGASATAGPGATGGEYTEILLVTFPAGDSLAADSCRVRVTVGTQSAVAEGPGGLRFGVQPNHPNPFREATRIRFSLAAAEPVAVRVFSIDGRLVRTLAERAMPAGPHEMAWDGRDAAGVEAPSGIYFYRVTTASGREATGRMMRVR